MIYDDAMQELKDRGIYKYETYAPFYISSFAVHHFNLMNQKRRIHWISKDIPNNRLHILFVSPAGFMKSHFIKQMAGTEYSIFRGSGTKIGYEQEMTSPAFTGTSATNNGVKTQYVGAAREFEEGVLLIDEFKGLTDALTTQGNGQLESQLLAVLDSGKVVKRLANDKIEYTTHLTMWTGVQPAKFDVSSGLGRRLCYMLYTPTRKDNEILIDAMAHAQGMKPEIATMNRIWLKQKSFINDLKNIEKIEYCDDVWAAYKRHKVFSFETTFFNTMLLGMTLAKEEVGKKIEVSLDDKDAKAVFDREKEWRKKIGQGVNYIQIINIVNQLGTSVSINDLYDECTMLGLNMTQVNDIVTEMVRNGLLMRKGNMVELYKR